MPAPSRRCRGDMLQEDAWTGLLEVFTAENRVQHGGSKEKEGKGNRGDKGE